MTMSKRLAPALLALPLALSGVVATAAPAAADDRRCSGVIGPRYVDGNVIVPKGEKCVLRGTRVDGNVLVRGNGVLVARGVKVGGNIQAANHRRVLVTVRKVDDRVVRSRVDGDVQLESGGRGRVVRTVVNGNIQTKQNRLRQVTNRNVVDGDLQAFSNQGGVRVFGNRIDGNLQCKSNDPKPVGDNNRVSGNKENQCRGF
ncbi:MAG TPA: hypothetical protein VFZ64_17980 [Nocardioidaceae bacterium]